MSPQNDTASEMAAKASETFSKGADLTREVIESQFRLSGDFANLAGSAVKGSGALAAGRAYVEAYWREAGNYWQAVADLNLRYANELMKIAANAGDQVLSAVDTAVKKGESAGDGAPESQS